MRLGVLICVAVLTGCSPAPSEHVTSQQQQFALAPAEGAPEQVERQRERDALIAAEGEARAPVDPMAQSVPAPPAPSVGRVVTLSLAELLPNEARAPRNGGSAAVIAADPASAIGSAKNLALCRALFATADEGGATRARSTGARPIYWLTREAPAVEIAAAASENAEPCAARVQAYDYPRGERLARKLGLMNAGPYLVAERHDLFERERVAAVIDLSRTPPERIGEAVRYFRDRMLREEDPWAAPRFAAADARADMAAFLMSNESDIPFTPRLVRAAREAGCPLTDLVDVCEAPG